ncbi:GNAT family N-acetyltransferase [Alkalihalobacillus sp. NPDC078783]
MIFTTERLQIRPFKDEDFEDVFHIYSDEEACQYLLHSAWTEEDKQAHFKKKLNNQILTDEKPLSLAVVNQTKVIGDLSVWYTGMKDTVEIGYSFAQSAGGKGYASEAVHGLIQKLFIENGVHRIQANLDARNKASFRLCERVGMRKEAHFIQDYWNKGEWTDSVVFGMLRSDLVKR